MNKFLVALSAAALIASTTAGFAGGLNGTVKDNTVVKGGPTSTVPAWLFIPLGGCLLACFQDGGDTGGTGDTGAAG